MELAMKAAGDKGKIQKYILLSVIFVSLLTLILPVSYTYITKRPEFLCRRKDEIDSQFQPCEFTEEFCRPNSKFEIIKDPKHSINNFAYTFDLYCSRSFYPPMLSSTFFFGAILGCLFLSSIPDIYGRKNIFTILSLLSCFMYLNTIFVLGPVHLLIIYFLSGFFSFAFGMSSVLVNEFAARRLAGLVMSLNNGIYPVFGVVLGFYFMFVNNWKILFIISFIIYCYICYIILKYFVESPRWLNSQRRTDDCISVLAKIAEVNGRTKEWEEFIENNRSILFYIILDLIQPDNVKDKQKEDIMSIFKIFTFKSQRRNFLMSIYMWFTGGFCLYGILLNLGNMEGDFFSDSILAFTGEMISELSTGPISDIFGRVFVMNVGSGMGAIFLLLYKMVDSNWIKTLFIFLSTFGYSAIFNVVFLYTPELFPTSIKGTVCGFCYLVSRIGAMIVSPLSEMLGKKVDYIVIIGGFSLVAVLSNMEETLGKEMQDQVPEMEGTSSFVVLEMSQPSDTKFDVVSEDKFNISSKYFNK